MHFFVLYDGFGMSSVKWQSKRAVSVPVIIFSKTKQFTRLQHLFCQDLIQRFFFFLLSFKIRFFISVLVFVESLKVSGIYCPRSKSVCIKTNKDYDHFHSFCPERFHVVMDVYLRRCGLEMKCQTLMWF